MHEEHPNVLLRGGHLDGQQLHLGRGEEPRTYIAPDGEVYQATKEWEGTLLVYRVASRRVLARQPRAVQR